VQAKIVNVTDVTPHNVGATAMVSLTHAAPWTHLAGSGGAASSYDPLRFTSSRHLVITSPFELSEQTMTDCRLLDAAVGAFSPTRRVHHYPGVGGAPGTVASPSAAGRSLLSVPVARLHDPVMFGSLGAEVTSDVAQLLAGSAPLSAAESQVVAPQSLLSAAARRLLDGAATSTGKPNERPMVAMMRGQHQITPFDQFDHRVRAAATGLSSTSAIGGMALVEAELEQRKALVGAFASGPKPHVVALHVVLTAYPTADAASVAPNPDASDASRARFIAQQQQLRERLQTVWLQHVLNPVCGAVRSGLHLTPLSDGKKSQKSSDDADMMRVLTHAPRCDAVYRALLSQALDGAIGGADSDSTRGGMQHSKMPRRAAPTGNLQLLPTTDDFALWSLRCDAVSVAVGEPLL
jgi:hypothetical protein